MKLDILYLIIVVFAIIKGWRKGLIVAVLSVIGLVVGLAAALKLSTVVAGWLGTINISAQWLPVISFILVFVLVVVLVRWLANILHKTVEMAWLGWVDRLGGAILYILLDTLIFSVLLFFAVQTRLVGAETLAASHVYHWIEPLGPLVMNWLGKLVPLFKDMFSELEQFFDRLAHKTPHQSANSY